MTTTRTARGAPGTVAGLVRPHLPWFAAVVVLQVTGALAGLAPLLAVVELGRTLLAPGPPDHGHVWTAVVLGAGGLLVRLLCTAASSALAHLLDGRVQLAFRRELAAQLGRVPIGWLSRRRAGSSTRSWARTSPPSTRSSRTRRGSWCRRLSCRWCRSCTCSPSTGG